MTINDNPYSDLLAACEKEPIHIPGAVQNYGMLLTVEPEQFLIQNISENCAYYWGMPAESLIGKSLKELLNQEEISKIISYLQGGNLNEQSPLLISLSHEGKAETAWELHAHMFADLLYLELEPAEGLLRPVDALSLHRKIRDAIQSLQQAKSLQGLCENAARQVKEITGFDRVMVYRFDPDWHGVVIAEACNPDVASYLGHHFPASDIPAQARAIFVQNWLRMIPDVDYRPSRVHPGVHPVSGAPLDLSKSMLRSVSPIHLQYLRNMNVKASLTVSLMDQDKLWGLIACHHESPLLIHSETRLAAQLIGQITSAQIRIKEDLEDLEYKYRLQQTHERLVSFMKQEEDLVQGLIRYSPNMLDIAAAQGAAAAIYYNNTWAIIGKTPTVEQIESLVTWLAAHHPESSVFQTNSLSHLFPEAAAYKDVASGVLAIAIPKTERNYILWFRPEVATTVIWAGNPNKSMTVSPDHTKLHPRLSFHSWKQVVEGKAEPWKKVEIEAVEELRNSILALDLQREFRKEQAARAEAEKAIREKDDMVMMVSHDLRTPLSVAKMAFDFLKKFKPSNEPAVQNIVERGIRATEAIEKLITNILDVARMEGGTLDLELQRENAEELVREAVDLTLPIAQEKGIDLIAMPACTHPIVNCERIRIEQVLNNLISNALKFTPVGGKVTVSVENQGDEIVFSVTDTGPGIPQQNLEKIFDRFWQAEQTRRLGTGLGLSIAKGIVENHKGRIWVESTVGAGTSFHFSLPAADPYP